jgi:two-component system response regulator HydG
MCDHDTIDVRDIPPEIHRVKRLMSGDAAGPSANLAGLPLNEVEKQHIINTLAAVGNNRAEAAKILNIGERTLYRKIKEYGL